MKKILSLLLIITTISYGQQTYNRTTKLMGCKFDITVVAQNKTIANAHINTAINEIKRIENNISSWNPNSKTSEINRNAGIKPVKVNKELFFLIQRAKAISKLTDGAFDISYASMDRIWKFDGTMTKAPSKKAIENSVKKIDYNNILLDKEKQTVFLKKAGMKIGFGGIGKGYAADKAKDLLIKKGVVAGIINASGDMNTWGKQPNGDSWKVAITNPMDKAKSFGLLPIENKAIVTSGNYEKYITINNKRYAHIIDPRTGYPSSGILSVSVLAPKAEIADALATSVFVMGIETGLNRINQLPNIDCIVIDDKGNIHRSKNIQIEKYKK